MNCAAVDLPCLDREVSGAVGSALADTTLKTRNFQWKRFIDFCKDNGLQPLPTTNHTVARFLVFQSCTSKFSTVNNYASAINKLHHFYGHNIDLRESFLIKLVLSGIKRQLGDTCTQKIPLTPTQLFNIYCKLDLQDENVATMWCALMLSFRTLLLKSNIVPANDLRHVLVRRDIVFASDGFHIYVR